MGLVNLKEISYNGALYDDRVIYRHTLFDDQERLLPRIFND